MRARQGCRRARQARRRARRRARQGAQAALARPARPLVLGVRRAPVWLKRKLTALPESRAILHTAGVTPGPP